MSEQGYVRVESGVFQMGAEPPPNVMDRGEPRPGPNWDEGPVHEVRITQPYEIAVARVTQREFARFKPDYEDLLKSFEINWDPDAPAVMVSWGEAMAYCQWLSEREGEPIRLPTEAEWEFAARDADAMGLQGIGDGFQEWCMDWWELYPAEPITDPLGAREGKVRVTRNHHPRLDTRSMSRVTERPLDEFRWRVTDRSANVPAIRERGLGLRLVRAPLPAGTYLEPAPVAEVFRNVSQQRFIWNKQSNPDRPLFETQVHIVPPDDAMEWRRLPYFSRHHVANVTWCDNGDLLVTAFTAPTDYSEQKALLLTRLRQGAEQWDPPARFIVAPDRSVGHGVLFNNGEGEIHYYHPISGAGLKHVSKDNGATWSEPRIVHVTPPGGPRFSPMMSIVRRSDGAMILPSDVGRGEGTAMFESTDNGESWKEVTRYGWNAEKFGKAGESAGWIAGIHNSPVELADGSWLSYGRIGDIDGRAPMSISRDGGRTWTYQASPFPPIDTSQKPVMLRLEEGPILLIWFTDPKEKNCERRGITKQGMDFVDENGDTHRGYGLFATLSCDEGQTWPVRKLIPEDPDLPWQTRYEGGVNMDMVQTSDGFIHLVDSRRYWRFNLAWVNQPMPAPRQ